MADETCRKIMCWRMDAISALVACGLPAFESRWVDSEGRKIPVCRVHADRIDDLMRARAAQIPLADLALARRP